MLSGVEEVAAGAEDHAGSTGWASETDSDASEGESEVDLDCEEAEFTLGDGKIIDKPSAFLKDILSDGERVSAEVETQTVEPEPSTKVIGGDIDSFLTGW
jgi:hypothetical protein